MTQITKSSIEDQEILTDITKKSKAYRAYSDEQIEHWAELLGITKTYIETNHLYKLIVIGYSMT